MSAGKNPYLRYNIINQCLTSKTKPYWTAQELMDKMGEYDIQIERRSLFNDFEAMRHDERLGYHAPITFCRKQLGYYYKNSHYSISAIPINDEDLRSLRMATRLLEQHKALPLFVQFKGVMDKLVTLVNHLHQPNKSKYISFETAPYYKGLGHLETLMTHIEAEEALEIGYQKFTGPSSVYIVHPYLLKEFKKRWYLFGWHEGRGIVTAFGLDRIEYIRKAAVTYRSNESIDVDTYFKNTLGVTYSGQAVEKVVLAFNSTIAPYIRTQHLHESQTILSDDINGLVISLELAVNYELTSLVLGYGNAVTVLAPPSLIQDIKKIATEMAGKYS